MAKLTSFLRESKQEFKRVNWPSRRETFKLVFIVIVISVVMAVFLGFWDYLFLEGLKVIVPEQELPIEAGGVEAIDSEGNPVEVQIETNNNEGSQNGQN